MTHLRTIWNDDLPRIMVDLGCHSGHTMYFNTSDAHLWTRHFRHPGGIIVVVGVDIFEDFVLDFSYRFRQKQYDNLKLSVHGVNALIRPQDLDSVNVANMNKQWVDCCKNAPRHCLFATRKGTYCAITRECFGKYPGNWGDGSSVVGVKTLVPQTNFPKSSPSFP